MKTTSTTLLVILLLAITGHLSAQRNITVEATSEDISNALDLRAVASIFGESTDLADFEQRLNNNDNEISNLDLNNDGYIDYLRVIETSENNTHLIVIQAVLGKDFYQDVATIVVEKNFWNKFYVQVIGAPFIYGNNYIIEPYFARVPFVVKWLWSPKYYRWNSPYYWGYYPRYYHYRAPVSINIYLGGIHTYININNRYRYTDRRRNDNIVKMYRPIERNDYGVRNPDRNFNNRYRNNDIHNKHDIERRNSFEYRDRDDHNNSDVKRHDNNNSGNRNEREKNYSNDNQKKDNDHSQRNNPFWNNDNKRTDANSNNQVNTRDNQNSNAGQNNRTTTNIQKPDKKESRHSRQEKKSDNNTNHQENRNQNNSRR